MAGQVWGGIETGLLSLSIIAILTFLTLWALLMLKQKRNAASRRLQKAMGAYLWPTAVITSCELSTPPNPPARTTPFLCCCFMLGSLRNEAVADEPFGRGGADFGMGKELGMLK